MTSDLPKKLNRKPDLGIASSLKWRYMIALVLVASLATAAWLSLRLVISEQESTAAIVNVSGRQRMLSQRTALFSNLLVISPNAERAGIRAKLKEAIELMERSHSGLIHGDSEMGLPASLSPTVSAMYFDGPNSLNNQVITYIKTVNDLLQLNDDSLTSDNPLLQYITNTAPTTLVAGLDKMVRQYQTEGEASIKGLAKAETTFWLLTLALLILEAGLIFHPFIRHMRAVIGELQNVTEELQKHKDQLEDIIEKRTAELRSKSNELSDSEEKFRLISAAAQDGIAIIGPDELVTYWNPAAEKIFGYSRDEIVGKNLHDLLAPLVHRDTAHYEFSRYRHSGQGKLIGSTFEIMSLRRDGAEFPIELSISSFQFHNSWHALGIIRDISKRKASEVALRASEEQLRLVLEGAELGFWDWNIVTGEVVRNERWATMLGYSHAEIKRSTQQWADFVHPDDREKAWQSINDVLANRSTEHKLEYRMLHKDGSHLWILDQAKVMQRDENGKPTRMSGIHNDITKIKQAQALLEQRERHLRAILDSTSECVKLVSKNGIILAMNPAGLSLIDAESENEILGQSIYHILVPKYREAFKAFNQRICDGESDTLQFETVGLKGSRRWMETHAVPFRIGPENEPIQLAFTQEITERKQHEQELEHIAHYDALTCLPNRVLLTDRLHQAMIHSERRNEVLALVYLDLDGFKAVNDNYDHQVGDKLLIAISQAMKEVLREGDTLARIGGDEFIAVLVDLERISDCDPVLERLLQAASTPVAIENLELQLSASIGVTFYPQDNVDADQLIRHADQAMYIAKQEGKNRFHVFDIFQDAAIKTQQAKLEDIHSALDNGEFVLYYQPKVNIRNGRVIGVEALIRWQHSELGLLAPAEFLPIIENHPLEILLGEWVIDTALKQIRQWQSVGLHLPISVNIAAKQFQQDNFVERVSSILALHADIQTFLLEFEVLETSAMEDLAAVSDKIKKCRELGLRFALDDFGTGFSSLTYLRHLPVDIVKIDQSFVRDMLDDPDDLSIVKGVIGLANNFSREVIAEGVESKNHAKMLLSIGCDLAQGYGIARPMPAADMPDWVNQWHLKETWKA